MQGDARMIEALNMRLAEELSAINQYTVHSEMLENWHYDKLYSPVWKRTITEMKHAEKLIERILYLEGRPIVSELNPLHIGAAVAEIHKNDLASEYDAVKNYNDSVALAVEVKDNGTKLLLEAILSDEEEHVDWLEAQLEQIDQTGLQNYLAQAISQDPS
jgi:bacterioferritin